MNKFENVYNEIIFEEKFSKLKWIYEFSYNDVEIFFNKEHVMDRLSTRDSKSDMDAYTLFLFYLIDFLIENKIYESKELKIKSEKYGLIRGFTFHEITSDSWICGVLQNDLNEKTYRLYFSTILSSDEHHHTIKDLFIEFEI